MLIRLFKVTTIFTIGHGFGNVIATTYSGNLSQADKHELARDASGGELFQFPECNRGRFPVRLEDAPVIHRDGEDRHGIGRGALEIENDAGGGASTHLSVPESIAHGSSSGAGCRRAAETLPV